MKKKIALLIIAIMLSSVLAITVQATTLEEGQKQSYELNKKQYIIELIFLTTEEAEFKLNGEITPLLSTGDRYTFQDGTILEVKDILFQDYAGEIRKAEFKINGITDLQLNENYNEGTIIGFDEAGRSIHGDKCVKLSEQLKVPAHNAELPKEGGQTTLK